MRIGRWFLGLYSSLKAGAGLEWTVRTAARHDHPVFAHWAVLLVDRLAFGVGDRHYLRVWADARGSRPVSEDGATIFLSPSSEVQQGEGAVVRLLADPARLGSADQRAP